ncbi:MAG TPA: sugar transferase [Gemmatimonadaceae bacterium]|nr:sugar transferase [Gemmatimonadaceae bacterium]
MTRAMRVRDMCAAALGLLVVWPALLAIAAAIRLDDGGPVLFRQERVGHRGRPFRIWKFRTMVVGADRMGQPLTVGADRRVTRVGRWLRRYKLDELPQLVNVLRGEMRLVGPRPEVPRYVALYSPTERRVLDLVPGITDPASIRYARESDELPAAAVDAERAYVTRIMPDKIRLNLDYAARATAWSDLSIVFSTVRRVVARQ